jgi:hypothetical protein
MKVGGQHPDCAPQRREVMISTVTTTTVTTIMTLATAGSLAVAGIVLLLLFLVQKELASASEGRFPVALGRVLNVAVVPLLLAFLFIVVVEVAQVLR